MRVIWFFPILVLLNYVIPYTLLANRASPLSIAFWVSLILAALLMTLFATSRWEYEE